MEFENGNKLKGYLNNESKRLNIHSNYAYTYYFLRRFMEKLLSNNSSKFVFKGSISQLSHTVKLTRAITDIDIISPLDIIDSSYIIEKEINNENMPIKFRLKDKFITTNDTVNFKILCNFDQIQHLIKIDLKKDSPYKTIVKPLPIVMKKDNPLDINTLPIEAHIATKMYIILRNANKDYYVSKETRRLKDFYDLHNLLQTEHNEDLVDFYFNKICIDRNDYDLANIDINLLGKKFVDDNLELYLSDKKRYGFSDNIEFDQLVNEAKKTISQKLK